MYSPTLTETDPVPSMKLRCEMRSPNLGQYCGFAAWAAQLTLSGDSYNLSPPLLNLLQRKYGKYILFYHFGY